MVGLSTHVVCCRFGILQEVAAGGEGGGPESALKLVHELLSKTLYVLHDLLIKGQRSLLLPVAQVRQHCSQLNCMPAIPASSATIDMRATQSGQT